MPQFKRCYKCGKIKSKSEYYPNKARYDEVSVYCKDCHLIYIRQWSKTPKGKAKQQRADQKYIKSGCKAEHAKNRYHYLQDKYGYYYRPVEWYPGARLIEALETAPIVEIKA